jgi:excisionase family DNA binding protein
MREALFPEKKPPVRVEDFKSHRLLVGGREAAELLSISPRALDYLVANKQIATRRIGTRVLIPMTELQKFSRVDHPARLSG